LNSLKVRLALLITLVFWSSAFIGIRIGLGGYSPGALALFRFIVASFSVGLLYARIHHPNPMPWSIKIQLMFIGVISIGIYNYSLNLGEVTVSAGIASFIVGLMPVMTILLCVIFLKERPATEVWLGIVVSLIGLALLIWGENSQATWNNGIFFILISSLTGAIYNVVQKPYLKTYHPVAFTAWVVWGGTLSLLWFFPDLNKEWHQAGYSANWAVLYLGIFPGAFAYAAWSYVLIHYTASRAAIYLYALPVLSTVMGMLILQEYPSLISLGGGLLALVGAIIASRY
jgi:drug/metabolite transporter (DMT)-like permease